jgi:hypothetical protein
MKKQNQSAKSAPSTITTNTVTAPAIQAPAYDFNRLEPIISRETSDLNRFEETLFRANLARTKYVLRRVEYIGSDRDGREVETIIPMTPIEAIFWVNDALTEGEFTGVLD